MEKFVLNNGLCVLVEPMPYLRSVSIGVWVKAGSMLETPAENGLSHFMEHMSFKGTGKRTARQIAEEMDCIGGQLNASTSKLCTNYYAKVIDEDLPLAADILADMVCHPALDEEETNKELLHRCFAAFRNPTNSTEQGVKNAIVNTVMNILPISDEDIMIWGTHASRTYFRTSKHPSLSVISPSLFIYSAVHSSAGTSYGSFSKSNPSFS